MEQLDLTTPEVKPDNNYYEVARLCLHWDAQIITIELSGENGEELQVTYTGDIALNLMRGLNKANLSTKSLNRRIMERLVADGKLSGSVSGTPD